MYGAPRVAQLQDYAEGTWSSTLKPRLETRRKWAAGEYEKHLGPYVDQVRKTGEPYAKKIYGELIDMYDTTIVPLYHRAVPYAKKAYEQSYHITTDIVFPNLQFAQQTTFEFLRRQVWPTLAVLYGENVEPQLTKIIERLGRYKDGKKLQAAVDEIEIKERVTSASTSIAPTAASSASRKVATPEPERESSPEPEPVPSPDTEEKIQHDLDNWKEKFAVASDKGAADLKLRVGEITSRQIENQAHGVGRELVVQLEETAKSRIEALKQDIIRLVKEVPEDAEQKIEDSYYDKIVQEVRNAGSAIKDKAQAVREWETKYDDDTTALVNGALESTLKIVDSIRDLGLQQIGMRWANIESVTYEDWSSYHDLKSEFDEWRVGVQDAALKHPGLAEARIEGDHVREAAMKAAQDAVAELVRLRDASKWKIAARDSTDDFSNKVVPPRAKKAAQSVVDKVKSAAGSSSSKPPLSKALDGASDGLSDAIESATASIADIFDDGVASASSLASAASATFDAATDSLKPSSSEGISASVESVAFAASGSLSEAADSLMPSAPLDDASSSVESFASKASSAGEEATESAKQSAGSVVSAAKYKTEQVSSAIIGTSPPAESQASSSVSSAYDSLLTQASSNIESVSSVVADEASTASSKVFGGAMAAKVEAKQFPIFDSGFTFDDDEDESLSEKISSLVDAASDRAGELTNAVNEALKGLTATPTQGAVESATSVAGDKIADALSKASAVLYGATPGAVESASSVAADKYAQAVTAYVYLHPSIPLFLPAIAKLEWSWALAPS